MNEPRERIEDLLPQDPPMILLSGCGPETDPGRADAWVDVSPASPFFEIAPDGVPSCVALEYIAQAAALLVGRRRRRGGLAPAIGFVLGSRRLETSVPFFENGRRYGVSASCSYEDGEFASFDCEIRDDRGAVVASARLSAYQPPDGAVPENTGTSE